MNPASDEMRDVKVSVAMITYNHERYIVQAVESALMQETDFHYEIVIGEDCSTDRTRDLVVALQQQHPDHIRLLLRESNLGMIPNFVATLEACRGQYIALCEGDDYWSDRLKLQKQADFLDHRPGCSVCFHNVNVVREGTDTSPQVYCPSGQKPVSNLEDVLRSNFLPTCSVVFRRGLFGEFPTWYHNMSVGDHPLHVLNAQHGSIGYVNEVMGVYRQHGGGAYTGLDHDKRYEGMLHLYDAYRAHLGSDYDGLIAETKCRHTGELLVEKVKLADSFEEGIATARRTLEQWKEAFAIPDVWRSKALGRVYAYYLYRSRTGQVDRRTARRCFVRVVRHDPTWLRNPGIWSIGADAILGATITAWLRRSPGIARKKLHRREAR